MPFLLVVFVKKTPSVNSFINFRLFHIIEDLCLHHYFLLGERSLRASVTFFSSPSVLNIKLLQGDVVHTLCLSA